MRIGIDARFYGSLGKGLGRYTEKLLSELERLDHENEYFIFLRQENFDEYVPANPRFRKALAHYAWYGWQEQFAFPRLLGSYRLDLVHFLHFNVPLFYRAPFIVTIHDLILLSHPTVKASELPPFLYWMKYFVYRQVIASAIRRAKRVLAVSQFTADDIGRHYPGSRSKLLVTHESADRSCYWTLPERAQSWRQSLPLSPKPYCLYVGNAYPHKNLELLLLAAQEMPETVFLLVGKEDYFYRRLRQKGEESHLNNLVFLGYVPDDELALLYRHAILYVFPSLYEGFGLPGLEATLYGLPVLASREGALPEILGPAARYFDPGDTKDFLSALRDLLEDAEKRQDLRRLGYLRHTRFDWSVLAEQTHTAYIQCGKSV